MIEKLLNMITYDMMRYNEIIIIRLVTSSEITTDDEM